MPTWYHVDMVDDCELMMCSPEPDIGWSRENGQLPRNWRILNAPYNTDAIISNLTLADAGTYICQGRNTQGSAQKKMNLMVKGIIKL